MGKSMSVEQEWLAHPLSGVELRAMRATGLAADLVSVNGDDDAKRRTAE